MKKSIPFIVLLVSLCVVISAREVSALPGEGAGPGARAVYDLLDNSKPAFDVFEKAYEGYLDLQNQSLVTKPILTIIDYTLSSVEKRLWVIDVVKIEIIHHDWVAHGKRSGEEFARSFSNTPGTNMSCVGFFATVRKEQVEIGILPERLC